MSGEKPVLWSIKYELKKSFKILSPILKVSSQTNSAFHMLSEDHVTVRKDGHASLCASQTDLSVD